MARTASLMDLMRAIVADDAETVSRLLDASPDLASAPLAEGATRQGATDYWFEEIGHYVWATRPCMSRPRHTGTRLRAD